MNTQKSEDLARANPQYNIARPGSFPIQIAHHQRRKMFASFVENMKPTEMDSILDVGVTSDSSYEHSNYFEIWYPIKAQITAAGLDEGASFLQTSYPGIKFIVADGRELPFPECAFDFVHSSAVLEHVGSRNGQVKFLAECWRVARKGVFITTPNRWFPVEFHTLLPFVHWLPANAFRRLLTLVGMDFFAKEENLNLMTRANLWLCAKDANLTSYRVLGTRLAGQTTNLLLIALKHSMPGVGSPS